MMMSSGIPALFSALALLLTMTQDQLQAASAIIEVKPESPKASGFRFKITQEDDLGNLIKLSVSIIEDGAHISRDARVTLGLFKADAESKEIETTQVLLAKRSKESLSLTFSVPKTSLKDQRYSFIFTNFVKREVDGKSIVMPSADFFVMRLHDFLQHERKQLAAPAMIVFQNRPETGIPREAREHQIVNPESQGTFKSLVGDSIKNISVRYVDKNWSSEEQVSDYLFGFLDNPKTAIYTFEIWSQHVGEPEIECLVTFKDHGQGKLLIWHTAACFRDVEGKWWFVSLFDHYHRHHPNGQRQLAPNVPVD